MHQSFRRFPLKLILLPVIVATLLLPVFNPGAALAAGRITLSVSEGKIGDTVLLSSTGLVAGVGVKAYFSSDAAVMGNEIDTRVTSYQVIGDATADNAANLPQIVFSVPLRLDNGRLPKAVGPGDYYIYLTFTGSKRIQAMATFFVLGPVSTTPTKGRIGDRVNVNGAGFKANEPIYIFFSVNRVLPGAAIDTQVTSYQNVGMADVTAAGTLGGGVAFQIPLRLADGKFPQDVHGGDYYFYTTNYLTRTRVETMTRFTVLGGEMSVVPDTGATGAEVGISGQGLRPSQEITIRYDDDVVMVKSGNTATTNVGAFTSTMIVPESTGGSHRITVSDVTGNQPETWFTVKPVISMIASAVPGARVQVSGTGFGDAEEIAIIVDRQAMSTEPAIITTNRKGTFTGSFQVPPPVGATLVQVTDKSGNRAEASLQRTQDPVINASVTLRPLTSPGSPAYVGQQITVSGAAFQPGATVTVTYGREPASVATSKADPRGAFEVAFAIPGGSAGENPVSISDGTSKVSASIILDSTPPPPPIPLLPEIVSGVKPTTRFDWSDVTDPSGVKYAYEISTESSFASVALQKIGLTQSEYMLRDTERLQLKGRQSAYYWRVQAVDGAGNASIWSVPILFYVGSAQSALPSWIIYALVALGVLLIIIVAQWLIKVSANRRF
jgi:hypothetical protein